MKLSAGTIGTVLFTAAGIAVFVLMAKRDPEGVDKSAMNFGMPMSSVVVEEKAPEATTPDAIPVSPETVTTSMPEATAPEMPAATPEVEPVKAEETTTMPATSESSVPASTDAEAKTEELPATTMPTDAPTVDGSTPSN